MKKEQIIDTLETLTHTFYVYDEKEKRYDEYYRQGYITRFDYLEESINAMEKKLNAAKEIFMLLEINPAYKRLVSPRTLDICRRMGGCF